MDVRSLNDWRAAEVLADPEQLFVLWCVYQGTCSTPVEFAYHYGREFAAVTIAAELVDFGMLKVTGDRLVVTHRGLEVIRELEEARLRINVEGKGGSGGKIHGAAERVRPLDVLGVVFAPGLVLFVLVLLWTLFSANAPNGLEWLESLALGAVHGLTEFLPVSSDGHLTFMQMAFAWMGGRSRTGAERLFFDVMLHLGTLAAIALHRRAQIYAGMRGILGATDVPPAYRRPNVIRLGMLAAVATLPLIPYAFFKHYLEAAFESMTAVGFGFLTTALVLLCSAKLRGGQKGPGDMTWKDALLVGIAQAYSPLPGVSRVGMTITAALGLGLSRSWAVDFHLLITFPAILGATVMELKDVDPLAVSAEGAAQTCAAVVVAGIVGYAAFLWLGKIVRSGRMWYFSVYMFMLAVVILAIASQGNLDVPGENAAVRPAPLVRPAK